MALNYLWVAFFLIGFVVACIKCFLFGDTEIFKILMDGVFDSSEMAVMKIALSLAGVMTFFMGLLNIGEKAGAIGFLARIVGPFFNKLFPEVIGNLINPTKQDIFYFSVPKGSDIIEKTPIWMDFSSIWENTMIYGIPAGGSDAAGRGFKIAEDVSESAKKSQVQGG